MDIINFDKLNKIQLTQAAQILTNEVPQGWASLSDAEDEINEILNDNEGSLCLAVVENDEVIAWAGLIPQYGKVFELHPLVVRRDKQRSGVGSMLLNTIENIARNQGGLTLILGSGDEKPGGETSLANVDLYENLPKRIAEFNAGSHPTAFYLKRGFAVVGVAPDAYGIGIPDIHMAKRLYQVVL
jgi:aminoglycoside 6'-N-acetyltransferase I